MDKNETSIYRLLVRVVFKLKNKDFLGAFSLFFFCFFSGTCYFSFCFF